MIVKLDVGGTKFKTYMNTLTNNSGYFRALFNGNWNNEKIFIDRDPEIFRIILNCFRNGKSIPAEYYEDADFYMCDKICGNNITIAVATAGSLTVLPDAHYTGLYVDCPNIDIDSHVVVNNIVIPLAVIKPYEYIYQILSNYHGPVSISHNFSTPIVIRKHIGVCDGCILNRITTYKKTDKKICINVMIGYPNAKLLQAKDNKNFCHSKIDVIFGPAYSGAQHYEQVHVDNIENTNEIVYCNKQEDPLSLDAHNE